VGLIAVAADKGAPGVTTASIAMAAVWPRPVLLAECDPAGGDLVYRLPSADGGRLDPRRGLLSLAVAARRGLPPSQVWGHAQKLRGGLDVLVGVTSAEQSAGLDPLWGQVGAALAALPQADVIADCGRLSIDGPHYDLLARADAIVLITGASVGELVRLRDRAAVIDAAMRRRGGTGGRVGVVVVADYRHFAAALAEVREVLSHGNCPASVIGGLAHEPKSAEMLRGEWGGKLDRSLLIRTAREIAAQLAAELPAPDESAVAAPPAIARPGTVRPPAIASSMPPAPAPALSNPALSNRALSNPALSNPAPPSAPDLAGRGKHAGPGVPASEPGAR
jgi:hypothetical protein